MQKLLQQYIPRDMMYCEKRGMYGRSTKKRNT